MKSTYSKKGHVHERRVKASSRLKKQLVDGVKTATIVEKNFAGITTKSTKRVPLSDTDRTRISKEIGILDSRI